MRPLGRALAVGFARRWSRRPIGLQRPLPVSHSKHAALPPAAQFVAAELWLLALVLTLSLMKAMVSTREVVSDNRIEHMRDAEQQSLLPAHGQLDLPDPVDTTRSRRHMATGNITFTRGQGSWSGYAGADVDAFGIL